MTDTTLNSPIADEGVGATLTDAAYRALRRDIISGLRAPGERLRIDRLRQLYRIGPTPLREALQRLAADGLVIGEGHRGFRVAALHAEEFMDLNIARTAVETSALRMSIARGDEVWEARVVAAAYRQEKADARLSDGQAEDMDAWEELNRAFHLALVSGCGSRWLLRARNMLHDQCERYRRASVMRHRTARNLLKEHRAISKAVLARDAEEACRLVALHFERTAVGLIESLSSQAASARRN